MEQKLRTAQDQLEHMQTQAKNDDELIKKERSKQVEQIVRAMVEPIQASLDTALGQIDAFRTRLSEWTERALTMDALEGVATVELLDARVNEVEDAVLSALAMHSGKPAPPPQPTPPLISSTLRSGK